MTRLMKKYWTVFRVGLLVLWVRSLLRGNNLPLVLERLNPRSVTRGADRDLFRDLVYYVDRWLQLFPYNIKGNCFPRSLSLFWLARRLGYPVLFHCGVRKDDARLSGHAWLTLHHQPFYEVGEQWKYFTVTFSYPTEQEAGGVRNSALTSDGHTSATS